MPDALLGGILSAVPTFYAFEVSLRGTVPRIWRSFLLRKSATFQDLHEAIQDACGWDNEHLFQFRASKRGSVIAGVPDHSGFAARVPDAEQVPLAGDVGVKRGLWCLYEYDFGDGWIHEVVLNDVVERDGRAKRVLTGGERAFPPEDSGGIPSFSRCVAAATGEGWKSSMGNEAERAELVGWLDGWKPDEFDLVATKRAFDS